MQHWHVYQQVSVGKSFAFLTFLASSHNGFFCLHVSVEREVLHRVLQSVQRGALGQGPDFVLV